VGNPVNIRIFYISFNRRVATMIEISIILLVAILYFYGAGHAKNIFRRFSPLVADDGIIHQAGCFLSKNSDGSYVYPLMSESGCCQNCKSFAIKHWFWPLILLGEIVIFPFRLAYKAGMRASKRPSDKW
jgi:hypothetical protein